ncbi:MAG: mycofactocin biosynthesis glycosyltransferase MftF [Mycobacterium sp.]|nr:mycofactocin biosynthesis glycosyltransferase MftF [Mycobacterium sp.]
MTRLPDGFAVQIDRRVRTVGGGSALLGGSPTRLLRLAPAARNMLQNGRLQVHDATSAELARALLDSTVAHPRPAGGPSHRDVTVVIPVRDNAVGLHRLVTALRGIRVVVVDDGSAIPVNAGDVGGADVEILRHPISRGPAAARNTGLTRCRTDYVAFLDADVLPRRGWLEALLGHFADPTVALAAPRIVALHPGGSLIARYEAMHSALDLGEREAPVTPYGPVSYVPSAAIVCRRATVVDIGGFDEALHSGEDVDLCWRLLAGGARLRYEPVALVAHEHRTGAREWLSRRAFYGGSAAPLALRHRANSAPVVIPLFSLLTWISVATGSLTGLLAAAVFAGLHTRKVTGTVCRSDLSVAETAVLAARGLGYGGLQLASAICRPYWPVAAVAAVLSQRARRVVLAAALIDAVRDRVTRSRQFEAGTMPIGPLSHLVLKRLDDIAYGAGLWRGVLRERTLRPLSPDIR